MFQESGERERENVSMGKMYYLFAKFWTLAQRHSAIPQFFFGGVSLREGRKVGEWIIDRHIKHEPLDMTITIFRHENSVYRTLKEHTRFSSFLKLFFEN